MKSTLRIKINDVVQVIAGKDKGKSGKVIQVLPGDRSVVVEGVNKMFKHLRPQKRGDKGQRIEFAAPLRAGKVMLLCTACKKPTRVGFRTEGGTKKRICKKCKQVVD